MPEESTIGCLQPVLYMIKSLLMKKEAILIRAVTVDDVSDIVRLRRFMFQFGFADSTEMRAKA